MNITHPNLKENFVARINALRGLAVILVFINHGIYNVYPGFYQDTYTPDGRFEVTKPAHWLNFMPFQFNLGITIFLLLSGFLIHLNMLKSGSPVSWSQFFSKRFWRIYPPYLLALLFSILAFGWGFYFISDSEGRAHFLSKVFLIHNFSDSTIYSITSSFWSLALEAQIYLLYPVLLWMRKKMGIGGMLTVTLSLSIGLAIFQAATGMKSPALESSVPALWFVWVGGAWLAEKYYHNNMRFAAGKALCLSLLSFIIMIPPKYYYATSFFTLFPKVLACFFLVLAVLEFQPWRKKLPLLNFLSLVGICSYSFFLFHEPLLVHFKHVFNLFHNGYAGKNIFLANALFKMGSIFLLTLLVSWSLYHWVEKPSIAIGKRLRGSYDF